MVLDIHRKNLDVAFFNSDSVAARRAGTLQSAGFEEIEFRSPGLKGGTAVGAGKQILFIVSFFDNLHSIVLL